MRLSKRFLLTLGTSAVLVAGGTGIALASIPDGSGAIHACYQNPPPAHGANLQVIDTGAGGSCGGGMTAVTWNQTGPQGAAGPTGPAGPAATSQVVTRAIHYDWTPDPGDLVLTDTQNVDCPAGTHAINGGVQQTVADPGGNLDRGGAFTVSDREVPFGAAGDTVNYGLPRPVNDNGSWRMRFTIQLPRTGISNPPAVGITVTLYAICE